MLTGVLVLCYKCGDARTYMSGSGIDAISGSKLIAECAGAFSKGVFAVLATVGLLRFGRTRFVASAWSGLSVRMLELIPFPLPFSVEEYEAPRLSRLETP
jgi:hypothetical protein